MAIIVAAAHAALKAQVAKINALNVYPVPDGDTGTNMLLTLESVLKDTEGRSDDNVESAVKAGARAALMGARGNSGVILSQMIRGGCEVLARKTSFTFTAEDFAAALEGAQERAYSSTRQPVEGTMLTVIKDAAVAARAALKDKSVDLPSVVKAAAMEAHASVKRTPQKLAVLKEAGVVDAGGLGVAVILDGIYASLTGKEVEVPDLGDDKVTSDETFDAPDLDAIHAGEEAWGYCTEFFVTGFDGDPEAFEQEMQDSGKSVLVICDEDLVKVHLHTRDPGSTLSYAGGFGRLMGVKIEDMEAQVGSRMGQEKPPQRDVAVVVASRGAGNRRLFEEMGAFVIEGGQGANPSASDFAEAIEKTGAKTVILLPNNKNIIPTAEQVGGVVDAEVHVVATKTIAAGVATMVGFDAEDDPQDVVEEMRDILGGLRVAEITTSVRDAKVDGHDVREGDFLGIVDGKVEATASTLKEVSVAVARMLLDGGSDVITVLRGEDISNDELEEIITEIQSLDDELEVDVRDGGQPLYPIQMVAE